MRVLVIEDDAETASYIRNGLTEEGHCVDVVADGRDGLIQASTDDYDVMIVDRMHVAEVTIGLLPASLTSRRSTGALGALRDVGKSVDCQTIFAPALCSRRLCWTFTAGEMASADYQQHPE